MSSFTWRKEGHVFSYMMSCPLLLVLLSFRLICTEGKITIRSTRGMRPAAIDDLKDEYLN